jgi:hypothetical protein
VSIGHHSDNYIPAFNYPTRQVLSCSCFYPWWCLGACIKQADVLVKAGKIDHNVSSPAILRTVQEKRKCMESSFTTNGGIDIAILNDCARREKQG